MKIYIIQKSGVYDYEQFAIIEYVTTDFEEAKNEYEKMKKTEFEHFKKYDNTREWSYNENKDNTMIEFYLDGYSMDDSSKIEIVEKVLDTEKYIEFEEHDYRVEIFDNEVIGSYCRGKNGSYKTNISSGGKMLAISVDNEFKNIALKAAKILNITTTIVDMIRSEKDGKIYVLEVNPIMGIFLEEAMRAGTKMDVQKDIPEQFKTDDLKIEKIINYIDDYFNK